MAKLKKGAEGELTRFEEKLRELEPGTPEYKECLSQANSVVELIDAKKRDGMINKIEWAKIGAYCGMAVLGFILDAGGVIPFRNALHKAGPKNWNSDLKRKEVFRKK